MTTLSATSRRPTFAMTGVAVVGTAGTLAWDKALGGDWLGQSQFTLGVVYVIVAGTVAASVAAATLALRSHSIRWSIASVFLVLVSVLSALIMIIAIYSSRHSSGLIGL